MQEMMQERFDVVVVGGAFSGASAALLLRREQPGLRVAVIERSERFDRKVGEATTEISGCFLTKRLALSHHLCHHHVTKNGLRFWFARDERDTFAECAELGAFYQVRLPSFQVDREVLDEHLLQLAREAGAEVFRPARLSQLTVTDDGGSTMVVSTLEGDRTLSARWVIDASGRAAVLGRKLDILRKVPEHPTNAIWARFRKVKDWDGPDLRSRFPEYAAACQASRATATNHLTGYGWWVWIIPLRGGDYSAGLVYDERLFTPPSEGRLGERLKTHLLAHPVGREIFGDSEVVEGDVKAYSSLPYYVDRLAGPGWQIVGDAAGFLDPLYSQGLDYCAYTVSRAVDRVVKEAAGKPVCLDTINADFRQSFRLWFESLYRDKYHYLGERDLMTAAFLLDLGLYFAGPVREVVTDPTAGFTAFPFEGKAGRLVGRFMSFYNRRLAGIARRRRAAGMSGQVNGAGRTLIRGFEPGWPCWKHLWRGARIWMAAEWSARSLRPLATPPVNS